MQLAGSWVLGRMWTHAQALPGCWSASALSWLLPVQQQSVLVDVSAGLLQQQQLVLWAPGL